MLEYIFSEEIFSFYDNKKFKTLQLFILNSKRLEDYAQ
jgi:hypothetical protein